MANTPVLNFEAVNTAGTPMNYDNRLEEDRISNANGDKLDAWAGQVSASFSTKFAFSGTMSTLLTTVLSDYSPTNRVIKEVNAWSSVTGSSGVTVIDVQRQQDGPGGAFVSIFSNTVYKPILSASYPTYTPYMTRTISGSLWKAGTLLKVLFTEAAVAMGDVVVNVRWAPSGSYGS